MKKLLIAAALSLACLGTQAASPFVTRTGSTGPGSATNYVVIPSFAGYQAILQSVQYRSATNVGVLGFQSGAGAWTQTATNTTTGVTNQISSTNGLVPGSFLVLEHAGTGYIAALASLGQATNGMLTNAVLASGGWGVAPSVGDSIYQLGTASTIPVGLGTNAVNGNCIFAGEPGRPIVVWLGPAGLTNYISATVEYR